MARNVRFVLNRRGVRELLRSQAMADDLAKRAERIAGTAGDGYEADVETGKARARASVRTVTPEAMREEATTRNLTRAIDAGR